jgi:hypothetical protein
LSSSIAASNQSSRVLWFCMDGYNKDGGGEG